MTNMPTIGEEEKFYGFIIGLAVQPRDNIDCHGPHTEMLATFEYNGPSIWRVPDAALFELLASHLVGMAQVREVTGGADYGYEKLWIQKKNGQWHVERS